MKSLVVTVANKPGEGDEARAKAVAERYDLPFVPRGFGKALEPILAGHDGVFVSARDGLTLWSKAGKLRWAEGMAHLRIERLDAGEGGDDQFLKHAQLRPGESILDCTLGLAQDALVAARVVGPSGRVVGLEKSRALFILTTEGLASHGAAIETIHADAATYLSTLPERSFDVVYFDPMHERPGRAQPSFEGLRAWADYAELTRETVEAARRVARRLVLVKGSRYSKDLRKLGLEAEKPAHSSTVIWARVDARGSSTP